MDDNLIANSRCLIIRSTTVSAPGKALIAGGYLVLEQPNIGVTISSTSRFYSTVQLQVFTHITEIPSSGQ